MLYFFIDYCKFLAAILNKKLNLSVFGFTLKDEANLDELEFLLKSFITQLAFYAIFPIIIVAQLIINNQQFAFFLCLMKV